MPDEHDSWTIWKRRLDVVATAAVIVTCAVVLWNVRGGRSSTVTPIVVPNTGRRPVPTSRIPPRPIEIDGGHSMGNQQARIALIEFSDFECSFCGRFAREVLPQLRRDFIDTGRLLFVFRHSPLEALHSRAMAAAVAADCAGQQGRFWEMHEFLFQLPQRLDDDSITSGAKHIGLAPARFSACQQTGLPAVSRSAAQARAWFVSGTPTFFLGTLADREVAVTQRLAGPTPEQLTSAITELLTMAEKGGSS